MFNVSNFTTTAASSQDNATKIVLVLNNTTKEVQKVDEVRLTDFVHEIFRGGDIYYYNNEDDEGGDLPDLTNAYLPPYPNPSRNPTVFQNSSNSSTFEFLFQFSPTFTNIFLLGCLALCTVWVIVMNMMIIGALLKGHRYDKEHVTDMYLINLLFADVLLGIFVFPFMSIVILVGYFPLGATWCNIWVYFDYYLIIASSYGFAALMCSYLMILRWPEYYPKSRRLHLMFILFIWIISNAPWTAPFINDRVSGLYPKGVCGFSIKKNRYFTFYIGFTGFYIPLAVALMAGIFAVKYLKQSERLPFLKLLLTSESSHVHPFVPSSDEPETTDSSDFNDLYQAPIRLNHKRCHQPQVNFHHSVNIKPRPGLSPSDLPSESTTEQSSGSADVSLPSQKKRPSLMNFKTFQRTKALQNSVRRHFPLVATSLILFVLSRSLFYTYFGIGSVVPTLFPPDLSHSVYWVMHSYAVAAPIVHLMLDKDLRKSVVRFINEGTFELSPFDVNASKTSSFNRRRIHKERAIIATEKMHHTRNHHNHHHCQNGKNNFIPHVAVINGSSSQQPHSNQHFQRWYPQTPHTPQQYYFHNGNGNSNHLNGAMRNHHPNYDYFYR